MSRFYLGVDGGQSSTKAVIADENGRIIGRGAAGPCNHVSGAEAKQKFAGAIRDCIEQACLDAGLDASSIEFAATCLGFSGGVEDKETDTREIIRSKKYKFTHDAEIALSGATEAQPGIIVIAGTGSMGFGRDGDGKTARAGGWGYIFGDEGSAFDLMRQALRAALRFEEGWGPETALHERLLGATGARDANDLLHRFYTDQFPRDRIAALAPLITEAAEEGDKAAIEIVQHAASQLASLAHGVHEHLFQRLEAVRVCYTGGLFRSHAIRVNFASEVKRAIGCDVLPPLYTPAAGAVLEALRMDGNGSRLSNLPERERCILP